MAKDPYQLLGVSKTASDDEIRKAYRSLAKKHHPDVNPGDEAAETRFKEITAAYNLLSDKNLRAAYDSGQVDASGQQQSPFGAGGFGRNGQGFGGFQRSSFNGPGDFDEMTDLFSSLFGMNMGGMKSGRGGFGRRPQKGGDVRYAITLDLVTALKGGRKKVRMADGASLNVKIPKGIEDGTTLRLRGKGKPGVNGGPAGDAKVEVSVRNHKNLSREGRNLRLILPITLQEALKGGKVKIPMPDGTVQLSLPAGTNSGKTLRLKGKGVGGGDLLITTQIVLEDPKNEELLIWANSTENNFDPREGLL